METIEFVQINHHIKCISNLLNVFSMCSYLLVRIIRPCTSLHTINNRQWTFMNNMTILTYYWIGPFRSMSWYSLTPQPSANSIDFMVSGFPIIKKCTCNHYNLIIYFISIVLEVDMDFAHMWNNRHKIEKSIYFLSYMILCKDIMGISRMSEALC